MRALTKTLAGLVLALTCAAANAAPKDELHEAFGKFLKAHSFRATVTDMKNGTEVSSMEFVAPDRYRMKRSAGQQNLIIGDDMYMEMNGKLTKLPVPGVGQMTQQFRSERFLHDVEGDMAVTALPDDSVDGEPAKVYGYALTKPVKSDAKAWVSKKSGLVIQIESTGSFMGHTSTTRVRYSNFDDASIKIDEPN
jgi:outer membrane lipoprotein-sorting protein